MAELELSEEQKDRAVKIMNVFSAAFYLSQILSVVTMASHDGHEIDPGDSKVVHAINVMMKGFTEAWDSPESAKEDIVQFFLDLGLGVTPVALPFSEIGKPEN